MYHENESPVDSLVHLYVDGAFNRRELVRRVAKYTGSMAAALTALRGYDVFAQAATACPADVRVPEGAPDIVSREVVYPGEESQVLGYLAYPKSAEQRLIPGVIVIHENRGLVDHIKDVTRRVARAGFLGLAPDLLSRQGGTGQFPDPTQQAAAYGRTTVPQRQADLLSTLTYIKTLPNIVFDRIGTVGFCAGGGNVWLLSIAAEEIAAAVPFYGTPVPSTESIDRIKAPTLAIYAELDRNLTTQMAPVMTAMLQKQKTFGFVVYQGAGHAFHNDTSPAYNAEAACDAWVRTIAWFNKFLLQ
ncbi:MAG: dienelactone hydrolase family protein [Acidobacteriota bacterium]|nr:dienelactone hydrolase family protein [Acidobacteriota bacterium]